MGKQAQFKVVGAQGEMDRTVLERVVPPLEHMLRNAVAHGVEAPEQRAKRGKVAEGAITVALSREGADVVISNYKSRWSIKRYNSTTPTATDQTVPA